MNTWFTNAPFTNAQNTNTRYTLHTQVRPFYTDLLNTLLIAQERITMMYFTFV